MNENVTVQLEDLKKNVDDFFLITNAIIVCLMQCGFACLEAGSVRAKNATNIMMKNMLDMFISAICYWLLGYSLAFGSGSSFLGLGQYVAGHGLAEGALFSHWFFQFVFAATAATIVSGAVAERCSFTAYLAYSAAISGQLRVPGGEPLGMVPRGLVAERGLRGLRRQRGGAPPGRGVCARGSRRAGSPAGSFRPEDSRELARRTFHPAGRCWRDDFVHGLPGLQRRLVGSRVPARGWRASGPRAGQHCPGGRGGRPCCHGAGQGRTGGERLMELPDLAQRSPHRHGFSVRCSGPSGTVGVHSDGLGGRTDLLRRQQFAAETESGRPPGCGRRSPWRGVVGAAGGRSAAHGRSTRRGRDLGRPGRGLQRAGGSGDHRVGGRRVSRFVRCAQTRRCASSFPRGGAAGYGRDETLGAGVSRTPMARGPFTEKRWTPRGTGERRRRHRAEVR